MQVQDQQGDGDREDAVGERLEAGDGQILAGRDRKSFHDGQFPTPFSW
jgi:hypothetical protein